MRLPFPDPVRKTMLTWLAYSTLKAIEAMQSVSITHGDIKPSNIVIDRAGNIRLCDFGFAMQIPKSYYAVSSDRLTPLYAPLEVFSYFRSRKADIWSAAVSWYPLWHAYREVYGDAVDLVDLRRKHEARESVPIDTGDAQVGHLFQRSIVHDYNQRACHEELLKVPLFKTNPTALPDHPNSQSPFSLDMIARIAESCSQ
jgi:serine/threonine protein kinase